MNIQSIPTCVSISPDRLAFDQQGTVVRSLSGSGLFRSCTLHVQGDDATDIRLNSTCTFTWSEFGGEIPLGALSLFLYPARMHEYRFDFSFTVRRSDGLLRQYEFSESVIDRVGIFLLAVAPFLSEGSYAESFEAVNRLAVSHLLSCMQRDGFFSAEGRDRAVAAKVDAAEVLKKTVAARRKELEDLKKAGIITEAEFAAEVKKLEGAGK